MTRPRRRCWRRVAPGTRWLVTGRASPMPSAEQAARLWGAAGAIRTATRALPLADRAAYDQDTRAARATLGEAAWAAAYAAGGALPVQQALIAALAAARLAHTATAADEP